jgi:pimeloyl-ACP methyl ester carboxylesterase
MLCLHGYPESAWSYRFFLAAFRDQYHVVALDMPGYGETGALEGPVGWGQARQHRISAVVQHVADFVRAMGYDRCTLVSHDWGGMIGWNVAFAYPAMIERLVVLSCPHPRSWVRMSWPQVLKSSYILFFNLPSLPEWMMTRKAGQAVRNAIGGPTTGVSSHSHGPYTFTEEDLDAAVWATTRNPSAPLNYYRNALDKGNRDAPRSSSAKHPLDMPVLLLWGSRDAFLGVELMQGTEKWIAQGKFTSKVYSGCSHWVQQEPAYIEEVLSDVAAFLGSGPLNFASMRALLSQ